MLFIVPVA